MDRNRRRIGWALLWMAAGGPLAAQAQEPAARGPLVNLRIELRQTEADERQSSGVGARVAISAGERVAGRVGVDAGVRESRGAYGSRQQVLVLNGGRAGVRLAQSVPLQWWQAVPLPPGTAGGPGVMWVPGTVFLEAGRGFTVQPSWPGGDAPVRVEVAAEGGSLGGSGWSSGGRPVQQSSQVLTTLQLPLGEWVTVAESAGQDERRERGLLSRGGETASHRLQLQMRVTAP